MPVEAENVLETLGEKREVRGVQPRSPSHLCLRKVPERASTTFFLCLLVKTGSLSHWVRGLMSEKNKF